MEEYQKRVVDEMFQLKDRVIKLQSFVNSEKFSALTAEEQDLLLRQLDVMSQYNDILDERIERFDK